MVWEEKGWKCRYQRNGTAGTQSSERPEPLVSKRLKLCGLRVQSELVVCYLPSFVCYLPSEPPPPPPSPPPVCNVNTGKPFPFTQFFNVVFSSVLLKTHRKYFNMFSHCFPFFNISMPSQLNDKIAVVFFSMSLVTMNILVPSL